ncbi:MAG TPA: hypothetical protein VG820_09935 [Fimbriimonadaceae bacterium]|nr:hypothetical protein [Fimbriimonadaceae bacterium]
MNSRERLIAAARGGEVDRKPLICWPKPCPESDAVVGQVNPAQISLCPVVNPFGQALRSGAEVWDVLAEDPRRGEKMLDELVGKTRSEIRAAFEHGADGVLYLLYGARGLHTTPMEYGGHYLERDRELLTEIEDATFNLIFVVGEDDAYLDFVSDLPAHAFGWDAVATQTTPAQLREMRSGALAANAPDADIELRFGTPNLIADLELELQTTHV